MPEITHVFAAGVAGSILMSLVMGLISRAELANADMVRALGGLLTRSRQNAFPVGLLIHLAAGALFAIPYTWILRSSGIEALPAQVVMGAALGLFHGAAMSFVLLAVVSDKHPLPEFREVGFEVAAAHVVGHVAYGAGVGLACGLMLR